MTYEFVPSNYSDDAKLYIYFDGEKTYDENGSGQSSSSKVSLKIYDKDGYVVEADTFFSPALQVGEKFRGESVIIWNISPGSYTLELLNTN